MDTQQRLEQQPGPPRRGSTTTILAVGLAILGMAVAVLATVLFLDREPAREVVSSPTAAPATVAPTEAPTAPPPVVTPQPAPVVAPAPAVTSGLFCRDLAARGWTYAEAVGYWISEGRPDRMDADLNGIPCETVYPRAEVDAYWGFYGYIPSGLYCRDLYSMGFSYGEAIWYWLDEGSPDRMDADLDGYPCETVYPAQEIIDYLGFLP